MIPRTKRGVSFHEASSTLVETRTYEHLTGLNHLENHDLARSISRFASDAPEYRVQSAKMLATYMLSISGTPIICTLRYTLYNFDVADQTLRCEQTKVVC